jgi:hypothetical protein
VCQDGEAAVELFAPAGGRYLYGLVGGGITPTATGQLEVVVGYSSVDGPPFGSSLLTPSTGDSFCIGMPVEFADAVSEAVALATAGLARERIPDARLVIDCSVHSAVGSCKVVFEYLMCVLIRILIAERPTLTMERLRSLFPEDFSWADGVSSPGGAGS